jgi:hypothetical protein
MLYRFHGDVVSTLFVSARGLVVRLEADLIDYNMRSFDDLRLGKMIGPVFEKIAGQTSHAQFLVSRGRGLGRSAYL